MGAVIALALNVMMVHVFPIEYLIEDNRTFVGPTRSIKHVTFGYNDLIADSLWIRLVQDYGVCEQGLAPSNNDRLDVNRTYDCKKGWVYQMLDVITHLAPKFRMPYATGATVLSVVVDDIEGATLIYNKGIRQFPRDWSILYRAAYHYLFELENRQKAAELLVRAANNGGPFWLQSLAAKLYTQTGRALLAKTVLEQYLRVHGGKFGEERIRKRLDLVNKALKEEEDLLLGKSAK